MKRYKVDVSFSLVGPVEIDGEKYTLQEAIGSTEEWLKSEFDGDEMVNLPDGSVRASSKEDQSYVIWKVTGETIEES